MQKYTYKTEEGTVYEFTYSDGTPSSLTVGDDGTVIYACGNRKTKFTLADCQSYDEKDVLGNVTTDKQAMAMSFMLIGDKITSEQMFGGEPLSVRDVKHFLSNADDIDTAERPYDFAVNLCSRNLNRFKPASDGNNGDVWGKIDAKDVVAFINKDIFISELAKEGFSFDAVKKKWLENGYTEKSGRGYFVHYTSCYGISAYFIKLKLPKEKLKMEGLPFEEGEK